MPLWRQGDLLIETCAPRPGQDPARRVKNGVLAKGEQTGHVHRVLPRRAARLYDLGASLYLEALAPVSVVHPEHGPIPLSPGTYRVWRQREFTGRDARPVRD